jgi:phosphate transport system substrate-binding protein
MADGEYAEEFSGCPLKQCESAATNRLRSGVRHTHVAIAFTDVSPGANMQKLPLLVLSLLVATMNMAAAGQVSLHGSTTVNNMILTPKKAEIEKASGQQLEIVGNGSGRGIADLVAGKAQVAMISAPLEDEVKKLNEKTPGAVDGASLKAHQIGETRVAFAVHPSNTVKSLTNAQLADVFAGKIKNWKEIGGTDQPIVIVAAQPGDGLRAMVEATLIKGASLPGDTRAMSNANQVAKIVAQLPGAIGILAPAAIDSSVAELRGETSIVQPLILVTMGEETAEIKQVLEAAATAGKSL